MPNAISWLARSGATWREPPGRHGPWKSVATLFHRWRDGGLLGRLLAAPQAADARGEVDWSPRLVDSTIIRAHQHAAEAEGGRKRSASGAAGAGSAPSFNRGATGRLSPSPSCSCQAGPMIGGRSRRCSGAATSNGRITAGDKGHANRRTRAGCRKCGILKRWRRIATRYDKKASSYAAHVILAMIRVWV